jgi:hypothetical protein
VAHLEHEALSSYLSTAKKKTKKVIIIMLEWTLICGAKAPFPDWSLLSSYIIVQSPAHNHCISQLSITVTKCLRWSSYKKQRLISSHGFRGSSLWWLGLAAFRLMVRQHIMVKTHGKGKLLTSWWPGRKRKRERGWDRNIPFKDMPPRWSNFLPPDSTS